LYLDDAGKASSHLPDKLPVEVAAAGDERSLCRSTSSDYVRAAQWWRPRVANDDRSPLPLGSSPPPAAMQQQTASGERIGEVRGFGPWGGARPLIYGRREPEPGPGGGQ